MNNKIRLIPAYIYLFTLSLFLLGVVVQVYLSGLAAVARTMSWTAHVELGHTLGLPLILALILMYIARLPRAIKILTWLLFLVYVIQADVLIFMKREAPLVAAMHPVLALVDFALALWLVVSVTRLLRQMVSPVVENG